MKIEKKGEYLLFLRKYINTSRRMKVAILGSGNGACAMAFEWARAGHDIYMYDFPQFSKSIDAIAAAKARKEKREENEVNPLGLWRARKGHLGKRENKKEGEEGE